jgi:hypothetical protein
VLFRFFEIDLVVFLLGLALDRNCSGFIALEILLIVLLGLFGLGRKLLF